MHTATASPTPIRHGRRAAFAGALLASAALPLAVEAQCNKTIEARVVALDHSVFYNRLGAFDPHAMMFALESDVVARDGSTAGPGNVQLRSGKRPRPLVLRVNQGDCLSVTLTNLLAPLPQGGEQPATRTASIHVAGMQVVNGIDDDGSHVGANPSSLVSPGGQPKTYTFFAQKEGTHLLYSTGATTGGEGDGGSLARGLFGAVNVEPVGAVWYRSQLTAEDLALATVGTTEPLPAGAGQPARAGGQPILNYAAVYPTGHPRAGMPIMAMLQGNRIVSGDLNAIIAGGGTNGHWPEGTFKEVKVEPNRHQPFREFTVIFHDETGVVQAFPEFEDPKLEFTLHGGRDAFAINYGSAGVGAEVIANRKGVGPMGKCPECKGEEFFLSSWAVGDPAMIVDNPANSGMRATKVHYPDDPSNVAHSYLGDRIKIRNLHAGPKEHHIFHLHAYQWLRSPDADNSTYLDSQGIGPGAGFTYEVAHNGSGNRNGTIGDAIMHCHFYPHFAQGMWALWRTHDVFESGTRLDGEGRAAPAARALPDGEIAAGTPIPAVVPLPGMPLMLMPDKAVNPGYPFYVAGKAGHRAPKPPLATPLDAATGKYMDGGLPRHVVVDGEGHGPITHLDMNKHVSKLEALALPEAGTADERLAMTFHAKKAHYTYSVDLAGKVTQSAIKTNGLPAVAGAPFSDPCKKDDGTAVAVNRRYKAAAFQLDVKYNKAGWHFPQHRMFSLWEDVQPTIAGTRAPQPLFMRTNSNDCIEYRLVNLVPNKYEMDDFQVTTPTDVIGQHIHLVKFDVTSSDGAANGFNYESGVLSPDEVRERVAAINAVGGIPSANVTDGVASLTSAKVQLTARAHPAFGNGPNNAWVGAQEMVSRWFTDDVLNTQQQDRTLRTIFTHDHFGPSTHQQTGLYAGLVGEPAGSQWRDPETGNYMGTRADGGPTSWRADIIAGSNGINSFREFNLMFADFAPAYRAEAKTFPNPALAINPPGKHHAETNADMHWLVKRPQVCPNGTAPPCPEIVMGDDPGTMLLNYRNEPLALRVRDPGSNKQAAGDAGDLSLAFSSQVTRADAAFNSQPSFYPALSKGVGDKDPYTPLLRAYESDRVQVRVMVGGQEEGHNFSVNGLKWLGEPSWSNSGYRNSQFMGLSEHYEFELPMLPGNTKSSSADYLYKPGSAADDLWNGLWGIMRAYRSTQNDLLALPNNPKGNTPAAPKNPRAFNGMCPVTAPVKQFDVSAVTAKQALAGGAIVYNARADLKDPTGIMYVRTADLDAAGQLRAGLRVEPLVLRANAGDCLEVTLRNRLPAAGVDDVDGWSTLPMLVDDFNANDVRPSNKVGLHTQLLATDVTKDDGADVGTNNGRTQLVAPGASYTYRWYAGHIERAADNTLTGVPAEFGAVNLIPSDPIQHSNKGLVGALVIEPQGATWAENDKDHKQLTTRASATITKADGTTFREFVLLFQDDVNLRDGSGAVPNLAEAEDAEDSGQKGFNYRTEPLWTRMGYRPDTPLHDTRLQDFSNVLSNQKVGGDPETPVFHAKAGTPVRFRLLHPGGHARNHVFQVHGHGWEENPFTNDSKALGDNPASEWKSAVDGIGPTSHLNLLLTNGAGGAFKKPGDYLFRDMSSFMFDGGLWGILRVTP